MNLRAWLAVIFWLMASRVISAQEADRPGQRADGTFLVPTMQLIQPAGDTLTFSGRAIDMALTPDAKTAFVKYEQGILVIDLETWKIRDQIGVGEGSSIHGIAVRRDGSHVYVSGDYNALWDGEISSAGTVTFTRKVNLLGAGGRGYSGPCGIALSPDQKTALVCLSLKNTLAVVDLESDKLVHDIVVGVAPYDVVVSPDGARAFVSNWGGRPPGKAERSANSEGTPVLVDKRGAALTGTISVIDLKQNREIREIATGLHPSGLALSVDGRTLYVANANSDTISVIDTSALRVTATISVRPDPALPFGSQPNALALSPDGKSLYVANGGNNAIAVVALPDGAQTNSVVKGFIPTCWFPGAVATDGRRLFVANVKGYGSRFDRENGKEWAASWSLGAVNRIDVPSDDQLKDYTARALANARVPQALRAWERAQTGQKPVPVPERMGEPSVFEHVVYIVKENRTYDQFLGDLPRANGDSNLCIFGREVTPNHHHLAEEFVALDNFYCNGVISADGHRWVTEGNVMAELEKGIIGSRRGDAFGTDPLNFSSSGFIWDDVLLHGLSFRNYGEMGRGGYSTTRTGPQRNTTKDMLDNPDAYQLTYEPASPVEALKTYSSPRYPGWELNIPDVLRARAFLQELAGYEKTGRWPNFIFIHLPNDHTGGNPTPRAQVADNDLALGQIIQGISRSKFWPKTCIFVIEDDPQSGFDHVDGHRSICFVASPYTKRHEVISRFYNQTSVLHTLELMLGISPMNQMDSLAPVMSECFTNTPDLSPYIALPNQVPLDEMPKPVAQLHGKELYWAKKLAAMRFDQPDLNDDNVLNRIIWHSVKGVDAPYPTAFAGSHGRGLQALGLKLIPTQDDDD